MVFDSTEVRSTHMETASAMLAIDTQASQLKNTSPLHSTFHIFTLIQLSDSYNPSMSMDETKKAPSTASSAARNILPAFFQGYASTKYFNSSQGIHNVPSSSSSSSTARPGKEATGEAPSATAPSLPPPTPSTNNGPRPLFGRRPWMAINLPAKKPPENAPTAAPDSRPVPRHLPSPDIVARGRTQSPVVGVSTSPPNDPSRLPSVPRTSTPSESSSNHSKSSLPTIHEVEEDIVDLRSPYV